MADTIVRVTHRYTVAAERVFEAWLTPALAGRFLFATRTGNILHCEIEPRVGGYFIVTDRRPVPDGEESFFEAQHRGTYLAIDRPRRLVFEFGIEPFVEDATRVTIDIAPGAGHTCELTLTHELGDSPEAEANATRTRQGWVATLQLLEKVLTTRSWGFRTPGSA